MEKSSEFPTADCASQPAGEYPNKPESAGRVDGTSHLDGCEERPPDSPWVLGTEASLLEAALTYAAHGIPVFPCKPDKKPCVSGGFKAASTDNAQIRQWWGKWPDALIGVPTGRVSGISVIDLDRRNDSNGLIAKDGEAELKNVMQANGWRLPSTLMVKTPSGGKHLYFQHREGFTNSAGTLGEGIDTRGEGGYVIAPPSILPDGRKYAWCHEQSVTAPAKAPEWLASGFRTHKWDYGSSQKASALLELDDLCERISTAKQGQRNDTLNASAFRCGQLIACGFLDRQQVKEKLTEAALLTGLDTEEANNTIASGLAAGEKKPRGKHGMRGEPVTIVASPYSWPKPSDIPPRDWILPGSIIRGHVSAIVAPGGVGKSSFTIAEAISLVSGKNLTGVQPAGTFNVWAWNGEDPREELDRRIAAACYYHGIRREDCAGNLFVNSGRDTVIKLVKQSKGGVKVVDPVFDAIIAEIRANAIDVLIIDPFISSHAVNENDNMAIDRAVKTWAKIAEEVSCAVVLVHHTRKTGNQQLGAEDARGASALINAARSVRVLNSMEAGESFVGVDNPNAYFSVSDGKANLAPRSSHEQWFKIEDVVLQNGSRSSSGDHVGVVCAVTLAKVGDSLTPQQVDEIQRLVDGKNYRENVQSDDWVGYAIASLLEKNPRNKADKAALNAIVKAMLKRGELLTEAKADQNGKGRKFIKVPRPRVLHTK